MWVSSTFQSTNLSARFSSELFFTGKTLGRVRSRPIRSSTSSAETLAMLLRVDGHEVMIAHDGSAALAAFGGFAPDIVLLDIGMPGPNGYEVAQKIRQSRSGAQIKLIAITGWGQETDKEKAFAAGFDHHLTKPVDTQQLSQLLAR